MSQVIFDEGRGSSPTIYYTIWAGASRNGSNVHVTFEIYASLSSGGYIYTRGPVTFYGGSYPGTTQAQTTIKERQNDPWYGEERYRICSFDVENRNSSMQVFFRVDVGDLSSAHAINEMSAWIDLPSYNAPTAPTWTNISPNPCNINSAPIISWGGAQAGSSGILTYDVAVRSTQTNGSWTDWLSISKAQSSTNYHEITLNGMNVYGIKPFVGVRYQYQIRVWDGVATYSNWVITPELNVEFTLPNAPNVWWSPNIVKKNAGTTSYWNGALGGSGYITNYKIVLSLTDKNQSTILSTKTYNNYGNDNLWVNVLNTFPNAKNGNYLKINVYTNNSWGQQSYSSNSAFALIKGNQLWIRKQRKLARR